MSTVAGDLVDGDAVTIAARFANVMERVERAARRAHRSPSEISVVAVSKTFPADAVHEAARAGVRDFGENRAQELTSKVAAVTDNVRWHFVGPLQRNKVRQVVGAVDLIHSVDGVELGRAIARRALSLGITQRVLVEVNVSGEAQKHGVEPEGAQVLAQELATVEGLDVVGLMTIPALPRDPEDSRPHYRALRRLRDAVAARVGHVEELSMGMTRDFEVAVEEGASIIRVGEAIFGSRAAT